jgi:predicted metal-dependent peptidase
MLRTRCGGTDFDAVAKFVNDTKNRGRWSGIIILTDGYAPTMSAVNGAKVLWVVTPSGTMDHVRPGDLACKMNAGEGGKFKAY